MSPNERYRMLDLFAGLGGASQAMRTDPRWEVTTVEIDPDLEPDVVADVYGYTAPKNLDLVWASPPCQAYSRFRQPWFDNELPDNRLMLRTLQVIADAAPTWFVIENVQGAAYFLGPPQKRAGPYYLWGRFPPFDAVTKKVKGAHDNKKTRAQLRAKVPWCVSAGLKLAVEVTT